MTLAIDNVRSLANICREGHTSSGGEIRRVLDEVKVFDVCKVCGNPYERKPKPYEIQRFGERLGVYVNILA